MKIHTDSLFRIGSSHKICQDYALHGMDYIVVSDGCSSSPDTDFGSRLISVSAKAFLMSDFWREHTGYDKFGKMIIEHAKGAADRLMLDYQSLDATLLCAFIQGDNVIIRAYGDGNVIVEHKDGLKEVINISFESGAPYYLSYQLNQARKDQYATVFAGAAVIDGMKWAHHIAMEWKFDIADIKSITLVTDGYDSFFKDKTNPFKLDVNEVIGFKSTKGEFLTRRVDRYLSDLKKNGVDHYDDFGIATMLFLEE